MRVTPASSIVYRHECECATASKAPLPDRLPEHRFDVDGDPFPWHIHEDGPTFLKTAAELYLCTVKIFPMVRATNELVEFRHFADKQPMFGDRAFPWSIVGPISYTVDRTGIPVLTLTFAADDVDADCEIAEEPAG